MNLHVISLPHTSTTSDYSWCAYTAKVKKFCDMMTDQGYDVYLYAGVENEAKCKEWITCTDTCYTDRYIPPFDPEHKIFKDFNNAAIESMRSRLEPHDIICLIGGRAQIDIKNAFPNHMICEFGIGYSGIIDDTYHVFESYAWMHSVYGSLVSDAHELNGRFYDTVIPNYFDVGEFLIGTPKGDAYLLYFGRLIERKGIQIAIDVAYRTGLPLHVVGAGDYPLPNWVTYHGVVGPYERSEIMGGAIALLAPTLYVEPFGGVTIEAMLCGTPAITTDWGAFTETIDQEWRCNSLGSFVDAVDRANHLTLTERDYLAYKTQSRFSLEAVGPQYDAYFKHLQTLWDKGFYQ